MLSRRLLILAVLLLTGCVALSVAMLDQRMGPADPARLDRPAAPVAGAPTYQHDVKPILDRRCVVCHGCYDAPCQLKLGSWEGIARGTSKSNVYDRLRLNDAEPTRLGVDAMWASEWRTRGFSPVLNDRDRSSENDLAGSVLWRALALKEAHPLPADPVLDSAHYDFSLDRANACPRLDEYEVYAKQQPEAGMPYGLPGLTGAQRQVIASWLKAGAPAEAPAPLPAAVERQRNEWEHFLNGGSLREQLVARYVYEHLFLGHLVFEGDGGHHYLKLVRSRTAPGKPVEIIPTRRPYDDPGVSRVWYRLVPETETVLAKTHMPYVLSPARMARWRQWFLAGTDGVTELPDYQAENASNPFRTYHQLPMQARYRFLLDDAGYFIMNFIKGPVCRGPIALDVIRDRFWVFFVDPAVGADDDAAQVVAREGEVMKLPAAQGTDASLLAWRSIAKAEDRLLAMKTQALQARFGGAQRITMDFIWQGDGHNPNAALTIFRHFDSASVVRGLVGEPPRTAWVVGYPLFERIYYLLVAGYDVYGNTAHQLQTRLAMDFLRMEGEANFLMMLPQAARLPTRDEWYRGVSDEVKQRILGGPYRFDAETGIPFPPKADPKLHLYGLMQRRLAPVLDHRFDLDARQVPDAAERAGLQQLAAVKGESLRWLSEVMLLRVDPPAGSKAAPRYYSVLRNTAHRNVSTLVLEKLMLEPREDNLTVVSGFIGAYPNAMLHARADELPALASGAAGLRSEADYRAWADRWAVRRTNPQFWDYSDQLMDAYQQWDRLDAGLIDWSRLENR